MATDHAPITPGSVAEAYEKTVSTPVAKTDTSSDDKKCSPRVLGNTFLGLGIFFVIVAIAYATVLPYAINKKIKSGVVLCKEEDYQKPAYLDPYGDCEDCTPYYYNLTMFNATNALAHLEKGEPLKLQEVGPYAYRRFEKKVAVSFDGEFVKFKKYTYHTFVPELSCSTCTENDLVYSYDVGYLNVITQAGGETEFLRKLIPSTIFGAALTPAEIDDLIAKNGSSIMRFMNGLNAMDAEAWTIIGGNFLPFMGSGATALEALDLSGFPFNGLFVRRTIKQWAKGYPSFLAGMGLGSFHFKTCKTGMYDKCDKCKGDECAKIFMECNKCRLAKKVVANNKATCDVMKNLYTAALGKEQAEAFAGSTCGTLCEVKGLCVAPLPGSVESSGMDWSEKEPPMEYLKEYIQNSGCKDMDKIGQYEQFDGYTKSPLWVKLDKRRNPTLKELAAFLTYGDCERPTANMTCPVVQGNDATSIKPNGVGVSGFASEPSVTANDMYLSQAKENVTLFYTNEHTELKGIPMVRFAPPSDLLKNTPLNDDKGTGYPVDGVRPLAFSVGFLAYLSFPVFLYGDKSLYENVEITMTNGEKATPATLFDGDKLKDEYAQKYLTYLDVEPGVGKTMNARKRLMASYAVAASSIDPKKSMSELVWPKLKPEVIVPAYWGEEKAEVSDKKADTFKKISGMTKSLLPVLIVGLIVGVGLIGGGVVYRRRAVASLTQNDA